jgi:Tat protein translocase TatC
MTSASMAVPQAPEDEVRMTFGEHLEELRSRLFKALVMLLLVLLVSMFRYEALVEFITQPYLKAMDMLGVPKADQRFIPGSFGGPIIAVMKLAFIMSLFIASPWIGYQAWAFVAAGLYRSEKKHVLTFAPASFLLFVAGCAFGYFLLVPMCLYGLANMMHLDVMSHQYVFSDYLSLVMMLTILLGGVFQVPIVMLFVAKIGLVDPRTYNKWAVRRTAILVNVVLAAVVTPADLITMFAVALPMILLYEVGVLASFVFVRPSRPPKTS